METRFDCGTWPEARLALIDAQMSSVEAFIISCRLFGPLAFEEQVIKA
jgi:hypothetical protein